MALELPTTSEVKALTSSNKDDSFIQLMIDDAAMILEEVPSVTGAAAPKQKAIVRWVAAHLLSVSTSGQLTQKAMGDASESYASNAASFGPGLQSTSYGQRAIALDPLLTNIGLRPILFRAL